MALQPQTRSRSPKTLIVSRDLSQTASSTLQLSVPAKAPSGLHRQEPYVYTHQHFLTTLSACSRAILQTYLIFLRIVKMILEVACVPRVLGRKERWRFPPLPSWFLGQVSFKPSEILLEVLVGHSPSSAACLNPLEPSRCGLLESITSSERGFFTEWMTVLFVTNHE